MTGMWSYHFEWGNYLDDVLMRYIDSIWCKVDWTKITPAHNATDGQCIVKFRLKLKHVLNNLKKQTQQVFPFISYPGNGNCITCNFQGLLLLKQLKLETTNNNENCNMTKSFFSQVAHRSRSPWHSHSHSLFQIAVNGSF